jgi:LPXTG-motif cell wall-anchored protein
MVGLFNQTMAPTINPGNTGAKFGSPEWMSDKTFRFSLEAPNTAAGTVTVTFPNGIFTGSKTGSFAIVARTHDGVAMHDTPSKNKLVVVDATAAPQQELPRTGGFGFELLGIMGIGGALVGAGLLGFIRRKKKD